MDINNQQIPLFDHIDLAQNHSTLVDSKQLLQSLFAGRLRGRELYHVYDWPVNRATLSKDLISQLKTRTKRLLLDGSTHVKCTCCGAVAHILVYVRTEPTAPQTHAQLVGYRQQTNEYVTFTDEHVTPRALFGSNHHCNRVIMCDVCNVNKAARVDVDLLERVMSGSTDQFVNWINPVVARSVCDMMHNVPKVFTSKSNQARFIARLLATARCINETDTVHTHMARLNKLLLDHVAPETRPQLAPYFHQHLHLIDPPVAAPAGFFSKIAAFVNAIFKRKFSEGNQAIQPN